MHTTAVPGNALSGRFARAVEYARVAHTGQVRKGTSIPYLTHLLSVATLVVEHGGTEDQAIAGLLHDLIEDCGTRHEPVIRTEFGDAVADIVLACTDGTAESKQGHTTLEAKRADWLTRKQAYLAHLAEAPEATLLVSACDKLHNARAIVQDLECPSVGTAVFERFTAGAEGSLWYYRALSNIFLSRNISAAPALHREVERMHVLAGR